MERRKFSREFKVEAVKLVREQGVSLQQAVSDLDLHETVLRKWINAQAADPVSALRAMVRANRSSWRLSSFAG